VNEELFRIVVHRKIVAARSEHDVNAHVFRALEGAFILF
jgi:hypothetical protein